MLPTVLSTTMAPFSTRQRAGERSLVMTHSSRFRPSNRTMASDGAALPSAPGTTLGGTGSHCSVSSGLAAPALSLFWPRAAAPESMSARLHRLNISLFIVVSGKIAASGMRRPGRLARCVGDAGIEAARRLDVAPRLGAAHLGGKVAEQCELLHHAEIVRRHRMLDARPCFACPHRRFTRVHRTFLLTVEGGEQSEPLRRRRL